MKHFGTGNLDEGVVWMFGLSLSKVTLSSSLVPYSASGQFNIIHQCSTTWFLMNCKMMHLLMKEIFPMRIKIAPMRTKMTMGVNLKGTKMIPNWMKLVVVAGALLNNALNIVAWLSYISFFQLYCLLFFCLFGLYFLFFVFFLTICTMPV